MLRVKNLHFGSFSDPLGLRGKAEIHALQYKARQSRAVFINPHFSVSSPPCVGAKELCALAHLGCTREVGTSYCIYIFQGMAANGGLSEKVVGS